MWKRCPVSGKRGYSSKSAARKAASFMKEKLRIYLCENCKRYHLTKYDGMPRVDHLFFLKLGRSKPKLKRGTGSFYSRKPKVDPEALLKAVAKKAASK